MTSFARIEKIVLTVLAAAILSLCAFVFVGCGKKPTRESGDTYCLYDEDDGTFDERESIHIDGEKCTIKSKGEDGMKDLTVDGKVLCDDKGGVRGSCGMIVTKLSDFMSEEGLEEFYDDLGVTSFDFEFTANIKFEFLGKRINNVLIVNSQSMKISGFTGLLSGMNGTQSTTEREVYCKKGETPDYSVPVTYDFNGGTLDGKSSVVVNTDKDGYYVFPQGMPTRDGYVFKRYETEHGSSVDEEDRAYWSDYTPIDELKAVWTKSITLTFDVNSSEYAVEGGNTLTVGENMLVELPRVVPAVPNTTTVFKGWHFGNVEATVPPQYRFTYSVTLTALYYDAQFVSDYNSTLNARSYRYWRPTPGSLTVHFRENDYSPNEIDWYGGTSWNFTAYAVSNGNKVPSVRYGGTGNSFWNDESGMICHIDSLDGYSGGDIYLEVTYSGEVKSGMVIRAADIDPNGAHVFIDESNIIVYRTKW